MKTETKTGPRILDNWVVLAVVAAYIVLSIPDVWEAVKNSVDFIKFFFYTYLKISFT